MFSKLSMTVLVALVAWSGLHVVVAADPDCPAGKQAYCCGTVVPDGLGINCAPYDAEDGCSGTITCCQSSERSIGFDCSAPK